MRWSAADSDGVSVDLVVTEDGIEVELGAWRLEISGRDDDAWSEATDLIAGALFGWIRIVQWTVGERWVRVRLDIRDGSRWIEGPERSRRHFAVWKKTTVSHLQNRREAPPLIRPSTRPGLLPSTPWVGLWAEDASVEAAALPLHGELDLHPFKPKDVAPLVREYIEACRTAGTLRLRLVHGKGIGNLRRTVHALLDKHDGIRSYRLGGHGEGSWGATIVELEPPSSD